jgi:hypothetical protein
MNLVHHQRLGSLNKSLSRRMVPRCGASVALQDTTVGSVTSVPMVKKMACVMILINCEFRSRIKRSSCNRSQRLLIKLLRVF